MERTHYHYHHRPKHHHLYQHLLKDVALSHILSDGLTQQDVKPAQAVAIGGKLKQWQLTVAGGCQCILPAAMAPIHHH